MTSAGFEKIDNGVKRPLESTLPAYLLVSLLIATSGVMFFYKNDEYIILGCLAGAFFFLYRNIRITYPVFLILAVFLILEFLQMLWFGQYTIKTSIGTAARIVFAYMVVRIADKEFLPAYVKIMYILAWISFFFYLTLFIPPVSSFLIGKVAPLFKPLFALPESRYAYTPNVILYNFNVDHIALNRNSGPFWESGTFGTYLVLAIVINTLMMGKLGGKTNTVLYIAVFTTFSTTAYLALVFFIIYFILMSRNMKNKYLFLTILVAGALIAFFTVDFLYTKIQSQISDVGVRTNRFHSAVSDLQIFIKKPLIGYGRGAMNKMTAVSFGTNMHRNNGVTGLLSEYGIIVFLYYFACYFKSFKHVFSTLESSSLKSLIVIVIVLILGFSQRVFLFPFFLGLLFLRDIDISEEKSGQDINAVIDEPN